MATNIADTRSALETEERTRREPGLPTAFAAIAVIIAIMAILSALIFVLMYAIGYGPTRTRAAAESAVPGMPAPTPAPAAPAGSAAPATPAAPAPPVTR